MIDDAKSAGAQSETPGSGAEDRSSQPPEKLALEAVDVGSATNTPVTRYSEESTIVAPASPMIGVIAGNNHSCYDRGGCRPFDQPTPAPEAGPAALSMDTAPKDGSLLRLLVDYRGEESVGPLEDADQAWTVGFNNLAHTGDDEWQLAGWNWSQDCFTEGHGEVIGWLPFHSGPAPEAEIGATDKGGAYSDGPGTGYNVFYNTSGADHDHGESSVIPKLGYVPEIGDPISVAERAFKAGLAYAGICEVTDPDEAWRTSSIRQDALSAIETPVSAWQGIDSAPKDGTKVVLWRPTMSGGKGYAGHGAWQDDKYANRPNPFWESVEKWIGRLEGRAHPPTHWMPLPAPPSTKEGGEA